MALKCPVIHFPVCIPITYAQCAAVVAREREICLQMVDTW